MEPQKEDLMQSWLQSKQSKPPLGGVQGWWVASREI